MIKNGVKYGMMNGVKGHPLEPSFAADATGLNRRPVAVGVPRGTRNYSSAAASSSPCTGLLPLVVSKIELLPNDLASSSLAATAQQPRTGGRVVCRRLCRQHAKVKLDKAGQLVPADVFH